MKYEFPANYGEDCVLVPIDKALVPLVAGALKQFEHRSWWVSETDYEQGYNAFAELQANMAGNCVRDLIESNNRLYRLLDSALNGTQYNSSPNPTDPARPLVTPEIPTAPPVTAPTEPAALRAQLARLRQLAENGATGAEFDASSAMLGTVGLDYDGSWRARLEAVQGTTGGFFGIGETPVTLADLLKAGRVNSTEDQSFIDESIDNVLETLSTGGSVADAVGDVVVAGADVASDGGVIAATIAAIAAQITSNALLAQKLQRLIDSIDGGGLVRPDGNVLERMKNIETMVS